jgi:probable addiction module antidote protein
MKPKEKITFEKWDPAEYIETKEDVIAFLEGALEENDPEFLFKTIGYIARSKGMAKIAKELNLNREGLYTALSPQGNPSFITIVRVLDNLGFQLSVKQKIPALAGMKFRESSTRIPPSDTPIDFVKIINENHA